MLPSEVFFNNFLDSMDNDKKMQCDIYEKDNNINIERFGNIQKISNVELDLHIKETLQVLMEKNF